MSRTFYGPGRREPPWHHERMSAPTTVLAPHRPPRHPHRGWILLLLSQAGVALLWLQAGWVVGLPALMLTHLAALWGTLRPDSRLFGPVLTRLPTTERVVWLTIDDGPSDDTHAVLDLLDAHEARATFFLVGDRARRRPDLVGEIVRRGHGVGNHSESHPQALFWALGPRRMQREIARTQHVLGEIAGTPPRWFRAVVGMANPFVAPALAPLGLARVGWSARGFDGVAADADAVVARIEAQLTPGAIILMHEGAPHGRNVAMLAKLLARLDALGYRCVVPEAVSEGSAAESGARAVAGLAE